MAFNKYTAWKVATFILVIVLIGSIFTAGFTKLGLPSVTNTVSKDEASTTAVSYINDNLLGGQATATLDSVEAANGVYVLNLSISGQSFKSYVTTDGKYLFPSGYELEEKTTGTTKEEETPAELTKTDKPKVEVFVMSHCPYGTQIEKGMLPVANLLGDKIDFSVKFVYYAMHGKKELDEQMLQYCIQKDFESKYNEYLACFLDKGESASCVTKVGLDQAKLDSCVKETDEKYKITENFNDKATWIGGNYPAFDIYKDLNEEYGVQGSPTLIINGVDVSSARDSASLLKAVCGAFKDAPAECEEELSSASPSAGFGYAEGSATSASCA